VNTRGTGYYVLFTSKGIRNRLRLAQRLAFSLSRCHMLLNPRAWKRRTLNRPHQPSQTFVKGPRCMFTNGYHYCQTTPRQRKLGSGSITRILVIPSSVMVSCYVSHPSTIGSREENIGRSTDRSLEEWSSWPSSRYNSVRRLLVIETVLRRIVEADNLSDED